YAIHSGERGEFDGTDNIQYSIAAAPEPDSFDRWAQSRDLREDHSVSARYVSRDIPGYDDLDDYGSWSEVPDYGPVWYPTVVYAGWAPYSWGYWSWIGPWGWTWVDYAPWGFAPFHYGRWAFIGGRWGWCPGPYYARPIYGPAFVGFVGGGSFGFSFGFGYGGGIGWFPLGYGEPFYPGWHCSRAFITNINIHNTYIRNVNFVNTTGFRNFNYAYARNTRAVTVASRTAFVGGRPIHGNAIRVNEASLRGAQVMNRAGFSPTRQSFLGEASMRGRVPRPPARIQDRPVMARTSPSRAASGIPVRTMNASNLRPGREGFAGPARGAENRPSAGANRFPAMGRAAETGAAANRARFGAQDNGRMTARQRELATDKPQFAGRQGASPRSNVSRVWEAQGNTTDRGRAPAGFGRENSPAAGPRSNEAREAHHRISATVLNPQTLAARTTVRSSRRSATTSSVTVLRTVQTAETRRNGRSTSRLSGAINSATVPRSIQTEATLSSGRITRRRDRIPRRPIPGLAATPLRRTPLQDPIRHHGVIPPPAAATPLPAAIRRPAVALEAVAVIAAETEAARAVVAECRTAVTKPSLFE